MLQQTQVARVQDFYPDFLDAFPTLPDLAAAPESQVRKQWEGLGYYRRASNLHRLAREVVTRYDGRIPADPTELRALPGIGRYTAGAVLSFAFEERHPAVDTNVSRVIRRVFHPRLSHGARGEHRVWETAERLVPRRGPATWSFNQGIMELGALICTARIKHCTRCPVRRGCRSAETAARPGARPRGLGS
jgi:A/G-specific adenine glycosylase